MVTCGLDPGAKGSVAFLCDTNGLILHPLPYCNGIVDVRALYALLRPYTLAALAIEVPSARPGTNSIQSTCISFQNHGRILGMCDAMNIPFTLVHPQTWQAKVVHPYAKPGIEDTKKRALSAARVLFPGESFLATPRSKVAHDGFVDASLISLWARLSLG